MSGWGCPIKLYQSPTCTHPKQHTANLHTAQRSPPSGHPPLSRDSQDDFNICPLHVEIRHGPASNSRRSQPAFLGAAIFELIAKSLLGRTPLSLHTRATPAAAQTVDVLSSRMHFDPQRGGASAFARCVCVCVCVCVCCVCVCWGAV